MTLSQAHHSGTMGQESGEIWTAETRLQPILPKSDRLLDNQRFSLRSTDHRLSFSAGSRLNRTFRDILWYFLSTVLPEIDGLPPYPADRVSPCSQDRRSKKPQLLRLHKRKNACHENYIQSLPYFSSDQKPTR